MATSLDAAIAAEARRVVRRSPLTYKQLAPLVGMSRAALHDRLYGRTRWSAVDLQRLADALGVDVRVFLQPVAAPTELDLEGVVA